MTKGAQLLNRFFQLQRDVAPRLGIGPSMLSLILAGKRLPSPETARAIRREFGVPLSAWTEESREKARPSRTERDRTIPHD